jgi:hypothetical protein
VVYAPIAPAWCDPVSRVPNFFGSFVGRGARACRNTFTSQTLTFTGGGEGVVIGNTIRIGPTFFGYDPPTVSGPGGPYTLTTDVTGTGANPTFVANENAELTALVRGNFPGASFVNGTITFRAPGDFDFYDFLFNYLFTTGQNICVNLPNPAGGGLVGRNRYFDNGSPQPRDRVYFFYNHVGNFQGLGTPFDINRYVLGIEKTFLQGDFSIEVRIPFAGTANSDQVGGQALAVDQAEFGNLGLVLKGVAYRSPTFLASVGFGVSLPTADDSRLFVANTPVVAIQNRTCLLQPMVGFIWAPGERFYSQLGLQFDFDPTGNPVQALNAAGGLSRIGTLRDQAYSFLSGAAGWWVYQNDTRALSGIALQGELHYDRSFGRVDSVQSGPVTVSDLTSRINALTASVGTIFQFGERTNLSVGVSLPLSGERLYDWNLIAQLNYQFGPRR